MAFCILLPEAHFKKRARKEISLVMFYEILSKYCLPVPYNIRNHTEAVNGHVNNT